MPVFLALAALQAVGGFQQAQITRQNGDLQYDIAKMNAKYAELDAFNARAEGQGNAAKYESQANQVIGADKAAFAGAGVSIGYGTANDVVTDNKIAAKNNVLQIQRQAQNKAVGYETQGINILLGGRMQQLQSGLNAAAEQSAGIMKAVATGVSGYAYSQTTGKGTTSKTGTDSSPTYDRPINMNMGGGPGDGVTNRMAWYPDSGPGGQPGFYGSGPRGSFTDEVG